MEGKGERQRYTYLNAEYHRTAMGNKKVFLNEQFKDIKENDKMVMTRDLFKNIRDNKGIFMQKWAQERTEIIRT